MAVVHYKSTHLFGLFVFGVLTDYASQLDELLTKKIQMMKELKGR